MKKASGKIIALIVSVIVAVGLFASCDLVAVNTDKDMQQIVASVQVENSAKEDIYKRELINGYVSYGYYYVLNYQYSTEQAYELILNNLVNNKVIVQYARIQLDKQNKKVSHSDSVKAYLNLPEAELLSDLAKLRVEYIQTILPYVTEVQIAQSVYNVKSNLNSILDSFDNSIENETAEREDETVSARTVPTVKTKKGEAVDEAYAEKNSLEKGITVEELTEEQKTAYDAWLVIKYNAYSMDVNTTARKAAANGFIDSFVENGLISEAEKTLLESKGKQFQLNNYLYYLELLANNLESYLISNYEDYLQETAESSITEGALWDEYVAAYNTQKASYSKDYSAYETALDGVTEDSYILYNPTIDGAKYGYVANILIGFSDAANAALTSFKGKGTTQAAIDAYRDELLKTLVAKDLRTTWLQSGYYKPEDKTAENKTYSFGDDYAKHLKTFYGTFEDATDYSVVKEENSYYFDNEANAWKWGDKEEDDYKASFKKIVPDEYTFDSFLTEIFGANLGTTANKVDGKIYDYEGTLEINETNLEIINDLLFAFGTDGGSLNKYLGYLYSPKTSASTYVEEFAEAAKLAVEAGEGTYYIVATDFGYHIIICTKVVEGSVGYYGNKEAETEAFNAFKADLETEGTIAYKFKKAKIDANVEKMVSDVVTYNISKFIDEDGNDYAVTKYHKSFKDLIASVSEN